MYYNNSVFWDDKDAILANYKHALLGKSTACNLYFLYKLDKTITAHVRSMRIETAGHIFMTLNYILQAFMWRESSPFWGYASPIVIGLMFYRYNRNVDRRERLVYIQEKLSEECKRSLYNDV